MIRKRTINEADWLNVEGSRDLSFESPGTYRIRVRGHVDERYSDRLGDMVITKAFTSEKEPMTILIGPMKDQAALSGVLNELYELHMSLLTLELLS